MRREDFLSGTSGEVTGIRATSRAIAVDSCAAAYDLATRRRSRLARAADGTLEVFPFEVQDSSMMRLLAAADCLVVRPPLAPAIAAGATVPIVPFPGGVLPI